MARDFFGAGVNIKKSVDQKRWREIDKVASQTMGFILEAHNSFAKGEKILWKAYEKAKLARDDEAGEFILGEMSRLFAMAGLLCKAEAALAARERMSPKSLHVKLGTAQYFFRYGGDSFRTLRKILEIKLPAKPGKLDFDAYYNALALKGQALLAVGKERQAVIVMKEFARFTAAHLDKTIFFRDLYFVTEMVNRRLGLRYCQAYLETINGVQQVPHDAAAAKALLRKAKRLLKA
jgi:hypothetical protein